MTNVSELVVGHHFLIMLLFCTWDLHVTNGKRLLASFSLFNSILHISSRPIKQRLVLHDKVFFESLAKCY